MSDPCVNPWLLIVRFSFDNSWPLLFCLARASNVAFFMANEVQYGFEIFKACYYRLIAALLSVAQIGA